MFSISLRHYSVILSSFYKIKISENCIFVCFIEEQINLNESCEDKRFFIVLHKFIHYVRLVLNQEKFTELDVDLNATLHDDLKQAPWVKKEVSIKYYIRTYIKPIVDSFTYKRLMPCGSGPGRLYGQAKQHKQGCPLRPVNSMIGTPEYHLAKWLDLFIKPFIPNEYSINSTKNFIDKLKGHRFRTSDICVSFDVESLFTNVPLSEVINHIADTLFARGNPFPTPQEKKAKRLSKPIFIKLMALCTEGIFLYNNAVYQQIDGCAMGSPLGPTLANWFLGKIESDIFITNVFLDYAPAFYVRYVDDIFAVFDSKAKCEQFFSYINTLHPNLRFTAEYPQGSLPFLDVEVSLLEGNIQTSVYRKPTNTGVLLNFNSVAPNQWKRSLITCFLSRARVVCSNNTLFHEEIRRLKTIFISNSYPASFFDNVVNRFLASLGASQQQADSGSDSCSETPFVYLQVVYVGGPSHTFGKRLAALIHDKHGIEIKVVFSTFKVGSYFGLKSRIPAMFKSNIVYKFTCSRDEGTSYIGMTTTQYFVRIEQHFDPLKKSAIFSHLVSCQTCRESNPRSLQFQILKQLQGERDTEIHEALQIRKYKPSLNKQLGSFQGCSFLLRVFK